MKKKGKFLTFIFSLMPGAGHMYLGFMKQGISLMLSFFTFIAFSIWMESAFPMLILPIIWFYSFFDVLNKNALPDEEFYALEDNFLFNITIEDLHNFHLGKFRVYVAGFLILFGSSILLSNFMSLVNRFLPESIYYALDDVIDLIPKFIVGVVIILIGVKLIVGKNNELKKEEQNLITMNEEMNQNENS